jgi:hypothetical protein
MTWLNCSVVCVKGNPVTGLNRGVCWWHKSEIVSSNEHQHVKWRLISKIVFRDQNTEDSVGWKPNNEYRQTQQYMVMGKVKTTDINIRYLLRACVCARACVCIYICMHTHAHVRKHKHNTIVGSNYTKSLTVYLRLKFYTNICNWRLN